MSESREDRPKFLDDMTATTEVARVQATVAQLQAEAMLLLLQRTHPTAAHVIPASPPALEQPEARLGAVPPGMLISEQVGSISVADWEGMSETRLRALDGALKKIVGRALIPGISWNSVGVVIQEELAAVGFVFNRTCDSVKYHGTDGWGVAEDKSLTDLVRLRGAARGATAAFGEYMWVDEMVRIAVRLMELRSV